MKSVVCALLCYCLTLIPSPSFGQGIRIDLVRFSTGGGQRMETIFSAKRAKAGENAALQLSGNLLLLADWFQTRDMADHPERYTESNIILGHHPKKGTVDLYMGGSMLLYNLGALTLPQPYRRVWHGGWIGIEAHCVGTNPEELGGRF